MALGTFVAGRYAGTYDPVGAPTVADIGLQEKGYEIGIEFKKQLIQESDGYGEMILDGIYRGCNSWIMGTALEWKAGILNMLLPYNTLAPSGATSLAAGVIGRLDSAVAGILVLTAVAGTASATTPASLTATYAIISTDQLRWMLTSEHRKMPWKMQILPYDVSGNATLWTAT
jgi:hypothetical protein